MKKYNAEKEFQRLLEEDGDGLFVSLGVNRGDDWISAEWYSSDFGTIFSRKPSLGEAVYDIRRQIEEKAGES